MKTFCKKPRIINTWKSFFIAFIIFLKIITTYLYILPCFTTNAFCKNQLFMYLRLNVLKLNDKTLNYKNKFLINDSKYTLRVKIFKFVFLSFRLFNATFQNAKTFLCMFQSTYFVIISDCAICKSMYRIYTNLKCLLFFNN